MSTCLLILASCNFKSVLDTYIWLRHIHIWDSFLLLNCLIFEVNLFIYSFFFYLLDSGHHSVALVGLKLTECTCIPRTDIKAPDTTPGRLAKPHDCGPVSRWMRGRERILGSKSLVCP